MGNVRILTTDGTSGDVSQVKATSNAVWTYSTEIRPGESSTTDSRVAIPVWKKTRVTATGAVAGIGAGNVIGGFICQTSTSLTITAYDDTSVVANSLIVPTTAALAVGQCVSPFGGGVGPVTVCNAPSVGMLITSGLYITVGGSGSFWVLYR